jgi:hypothetical protein
MPGMETARMRDVRASSARGPELDRHVEDLALYPRTRARGESQTVMKTL